MAAMIQPIRFGLKFEPPEIAMEYSVEDEVKLVRHRMEELGGEKWGAEEAFAALQTLHPSLFREDVVSVTQCVRLLGILKEKMEEGGAAPREQHPAQREVAPREEIVSEDISVTSAAEDLALSPFGVTSGDFLKNGESGFGESDVLSESQPVEIQFEEESLEEEQEALDEKEEPPVHDEEAQPTSDHESEVEVDEVEDYSEEEYEDDVEEDISKEEDDAQPDARDEMMDQTEVNSHNSYIDDEEASEEESLLSIEELSVGQGNESGGEDDDYF